MAEHRRTRQAGSTLRILYGVQATGQGHISRARAMAQALSEHDVEVNWLFSGRPQEQLFDMDIFGNYAHRSGLTFVTENGRLRYRKTLRHNNLLQFFRDVRELDVTAYDLVVCDYEPVTAWAARRCGRSVIGIGHQYAFGRATPVAGASLLQRTTMRLFAPVQQRVGLHWAPFDDQVLPPILDLPLCPDSAPGDHILVYLPFENQDTVTEWLQGLGSTTFVQYASSLHDERLGCVERRRATTAGFKRDLARCRGVICNSGFELISECLHWQKPVLTKPLMGQMEQQSNAAALALLGYASVIDSLDSQKARAWVAAPPAAPRVHFSDVATHLAAWLAGGATQEVAILGKNLWN